MTLRKPRNLEEAVGYAILILCAIGIAGGLFLLYEIVTYNPN